MSFEVAAALAILGSALFLYLVVRTGIEHKRLRTRKRSLGEVLVASKQHQEIVDELYLSAQSLRRKCQAEVSLWKPGEELLDDVARALDQCMTSLLQDDTAPIIDLTNWLKTAGEEWRSEAGYIHQLRADLTSRFSLSALP